MRRITNTYKAVCYRKELSPPERQLVYPHLLSMQGGKCAICGAVPPVPGNRFAVDHDHNGGRICGVLCAACNAMLGNAKDNPEILFKGIQYLEKMS